MSHTRTFGTTTFHYNSDMSGDVRVVRNGVSIEVPAQDIIAFVSGRLIDAAIARLEQIEPARLWKWLSK